MRDGCRFRVGSILSSALHRYVELRLEEILFLETFLFFFLETFLESRTAILRKRKKGSQTGHATYLAT
jgi:hypothetical protein